MLQTASCSCVGGNCSASTAEVLIARKGVDYLGEANCLLYHNFCFQLLVVVSLLSISLTSPFACHPDLSSFNYSCSTLYLPKFYSLSVMYLLHLHSLYVLLLQNHKELLFCMRLYSVEDLLSWFPPFNPWFPDRS